MTLIVAAAPARTRRFGSARARSMSPGRWAARCAVFFDFGRSRRLRFSRRRFGRALRHRFLFRTAACFLRCCFLRLSIFFRATFLFFALFVFLPLLAPTGFLQQSLAPSASRRSFSWTSLRRAISSWGGWRRCCGAPSTGFWEQEPGLRQQAWQPRAAALRRVARECAASSPPRQPCSSVHG